MKIDKSQIQMLEIELTGTCNLNCPLCVRANPEFDWFKKKNVRPLEDIVAQLDTFPNLTDVCVAGLISEPTHYDELIPLLQYLEGRNIEVELYINGNTKDESWWKHLGESIKCTKVIFTVCGSTQELHEKYRVGSDLDEIYRHAEAFRSSGNVNDYLQLISFNYNEKDLNDNYDYIVRGFNNVIVVNSLPYQERFGFDSDIKMTEELSKMYTRIKDSTLKRMDRSEVSCKSLEDKKFIIIDHYGNEYPCFLYMLYVNGEFEYDYTDIHEKKRDFCFECEKIAIKMLKINGLERMG